MPGEYLKAFRVGVVRGVRRGRARAVYGGQLLLAGLRVGARKRAEDGQQVGLPTALPKREILSPVGGAFYVAVWHLYVSGLQSRVSLYGALRKHLQGAAGADRSGSDRKFKEGRDQRMGRRDPNRRADRYIVRTASKSEQPLHRGKDY